MELINLTLVNRTLEFDNRSFYIEISKSITDHESAQQYIASLPDPKAMPIGKVIERIVRLNNGLKNFWSNAYGWAPLEAAQLLSRSRLDWQVSLSMCLKIWLNGSSTPDKTGRLILGWTNLGSLIEGVLKLFLSVWYDIYKSDIDVIKRKDRVQEPDGLSLEPLRQFFRKKIWDETWDNWIQHIQDRRNAIHAYKSRELGTHSEFLDDIRKYLQLLRYVNFRLPYPDEMYIPQEDERTMNREEMTIKIIAE